MNNFILSCHSQRKVDKVIMQKEQEFEKKRMALGENHPDTLN